MLSITTSMVITSHNGFKAENLPCGVCCAHSPADESPGPCAVEQIILHLSSARSLPLSETWHCLGSSPRTLRTCNLTLGIEDKLAMNPVFKLQCYWNVSQTKADPIFQFFQAPSEALWVRAPFMVFLNFMANLTQMYSLPQEGGE